MLSYDKDAVLLWEVIENGVIIPKSQNVLISEESISRQEFYAAQQSGMSISSIYRINTIDYEMSKHLESDTNKPLYATKIMIDGAVYDIVRTYLIKKEESLELVCS